MLPGEQVPGQLGADDGSVRDVTERLRRALLPRYVLEREIAQGGMGLVFLARDAGHDRQVAIKVLQPDRAAAIGRERFRREIRAAAQLVHPSILPVHDSGEADGLFYYVMPYVPGDSVRDRLQREGRLPLEEAVGIAVEVAEALDCAHRHGIIHRDLKPENILLTAPRHACLTDFGIAHTPSAPGEAQLTRTGLLLGSPLYVSPEQAGGEGEVDGRADLYSLGCVLFEMLTGDPPFSGHRLETVLLRHLTEPAPSLRSLRPDAPAWLDSIVARALAKLPGERFASAGEMAAALRAGLHSEPAQDSAGAPTEAPGSPSPAHPSAGGAASRGMRMRHRGSRLPRTAALAALATVLIAGVGAGVWAWRGRGGPRPESPVRATADPNRIAVLYFDDLSPHQDLGYLAAGLTETLIGQLSQVDALDVVSVNGVKPFRGGVTPTDSIARALNVGTLVEGSVQRSGERLRVSVQLVDVATGSPPRTTVVERTEGDLFALEDGVGDQVARFLRERLGQQLRIRRLQAQTRSVEAWKYFHEAEEVRDGLRLLQPFSDSASLATATALLNRADSLFARAERADRRWVAPTVERGLLAIDQSDLRPLDQGWVRSWLRRGEQIAAAAAARAPGNPGAAELSGRIDYRLALVAANRAEADRLLKQAEQKLRAATQADPTRASAWSGLSGLLQQEGRHAEASLVARRALKEDAYLEDATVILQRLFYSYFEVADFVNADRWCVTGERQFPGDPTFLECRLQLMAIAGVGVPDPTRAWEILREIDKRLAEGHGDQADPDRTAWRRMMVAGVLARAGLRDSARAVLLRTQHAVTADRALLTMRFAFYAAQVEFLLGNRDRALEWLGVFLRADSLQRDFVAHFFLFRPLTTDPRFQALLHPPA